MKQGIYLHIPFCVHKCPYCDFVSYPASAVEGKKDEVILALKKNVELWHDEKNVIDTAFFGGGTPSLLSPRTISELVRTIEKTYTCENNLEITVEINPGTVNKSYLKELMEAGVNRVSVGIQSFNDDTLKRIGRIHNAYEAKCTIQNAKEAGINNISADFIIGLPGQTLFEIEDNIITALGLGITHISCYDLTIDDNTEFGRLFAEGRLNLPDDNWMHNARVLIDDVLAQNGFIHYEISNYALEGYECIHNLHYWHNDPYIGIGPSAVGKTDRIRYKHSDSLDTYIRDISEGKKWNEIIETENDFDYIFNTFMLGMRLREGVHESLIERLNKQKQIQWKGLIKELTEKRVLERENERIIPTLRGWEIQNAWLYKFL